jgi:SRSO17 transposase
MQSITFKTPQACYENIQYFMSEAKWDHEELNNRRITLLQSSRATKSCKKGVLIIDDSGCKKWGLKTEGAKVQYYPTEGITTNCNIVVSSAYSDEIKTFPVNLKPYRPKEEFDLQDIDPDFKSKLDLAEELIRDAMDKNIQFSDILFDGWYLANNLLNFISEKRKTWISEASADRLISYRGKWTRADELVKLIPSIKFNHRVTVPNSKEENRSLLIYGFVSRLKGVKGRVLVVVAIGRWDKKDSKNIHIFVTNHLSLSPETVVKKYTLRWGIERMFRDLKENVAFDHYQVRKIIGITRHWHLAALAYTFLIWLKLTGAFTKTFSCEMKTMGDYLNAFRKLNSESCLQWMSKNQEKFRNYLGIQRNCLRQIAVLA